MPRGPLGSGKTRSVEGRVVASSHLSPSGQNCREVTHGVARPARVAGLTAHSRARVPEACPWAQMLLPSGPFPFFRSCCRTPADCHPGQRLRSEGNRWPLGAQLTSGLLPSCCFSPPACASWLSLPGWLPLHGPAVPLLLPRLPPGHTGRSRQQPGPLGLLCL